MAEVKFLTGTKAQYDGLESKDQGTLYFLSDVHKIMKGEDDFTSSVIFGESFPESNQAQGVLYIVGTTGKIWNGSTFVTVFEKAVPTPIVNDLTTGGTDKALSAEQGKVLKGQLDAHAGKLAGTNAGHVKTGADVEIAEGLITVKKINGQAWETIKQSIDAEIAKKANLTGATFTGDVKLTGSPAGDTSAVSKKYVDDKVTTAVGAVDAMRFKGTLGADGTVKTLPTTYKVGDTYRVVTAGTYAGEKCEVGDLLIAIVARQGSGNVDGDWTIAQTNIDGAVVGPASATDSTVVLFDGATGKRIKGSTITLTQLQNAITNSHTHANKANLDTYTKSMTQLESDIKDAAATDAESKVNAAKQEIQGLIDALNLEDLADTDLASKTNGQVIYWDGTAGKWKAKTVAQVDISGKMDKMSGDKANNITVSNGSGGVKDSGKAIGGATLASIPNANTVATEAAVKTYADSIQTVWEAIS